MRGLIDGLGTPHRLGGYLPTLYQEDDFCQRFLTAFDAALAPIFLVLDNLDSYLDPRLAPDDFVDWLGGWVGLMVDETWPLDRRRAFVGSAAELYRHRGSARGLAAYVEIFSSGEVEVIDNGGTKWSRTPGASFPGSERPSVTVQVKVQDPKGVDLRRLDALVAAAKPAHMAHHVEVSAG